MNGSRLLRAPLSQCQRRAISLTLPFALSLALVGLSAGVSHAQNPPIIDGQAWKDAIDTLRYARLYRPSINRDGRPSASINRAFTMLVDYASDERLVQMLEDPWPNLRVFAFWALAERNPGASQKVFNIAFDKLRDETIARSGGGCVVITTHVGDAIMSSIADDLTEPQRRRVIDYLLFQPNGLRLTDTVLRTWSIPPEYRETLRSLAKGSQPAALIALGHLYDERDTGFVIEQADRNKELAFAVMAEHPRDEYFTYLQSIATDIFTDHWPDYRYYTALAVHGSARAMPIFEAAFEQIQSNWRYNHLDRIFHAATHAAIEDAGFMPMLWTLWEREQIVDMDSFNLMWAEDQPRALTMIDKTLSQTDLGRVSGPLVVRMLRLLAGPERTAAPAVWQNVIANATYTHSDELSRYVSSFRPEGAIEPLFAKLLARDSEYMYVSVARAILGYKRADLDARLRKLVTDTPHLHEGWTGQSMLDLLKEHSVPES